MSKPYIIADVGTNWRRFNSAEENLNSAISHIERAKWANASAVKFQLFTHEELYGFKGPDDWALPLEWIPALETACRDHGIDFMCTAFSPKGVRLIDPFVSIHKLASCENQHLGMIEALVETKKPILVSMGATTQYEFQHFAERYYLPHDRFFFLECVAAYPAKPEDYNLKAIAELGWHGVSDHTWSFSMAPAAIGYGAFIFEKHFDIFRDTFAARDIPHTPDSGVAIGAVDLQRYVIGIREAFSACHQGSKVVQVSEREILAKAKRRMKCTKRIQAGEKLILGENFGFFRSLQDDFVASPPNLTRFLDGSIAIRDIEAGSGIHLGHVRTDLCPSGQ